jgi:hypothetical protein
MSISRCKFFIALAHLTSYKLNASINATVNLPSVVSGISIHIPKHPQRNTQQGADEMSTQVVNSEDDTPKKKLAAFQLSNTDIPDEAANIKVSTSSHTSL